MNDYQTIIYPDVNLPFAYFVDREVTVDSDFEVPMWHEELEIKLILAGCAEISCGSQVFVARAGDIVVVNSCEPHAMKAAGNGVIRYHIMMISPEQLYSDGLRHNLKPVFDGRVRFQNHISNDVCRELLEGIFRELETRREAYALAAVGGLSLFFAELLREHSLVSDETALERAVFKRYAKQVEPVFAEISGKCGSELRIKSLAALCDMSEYHFCRIFKQVTGKSVVTYINEFRISKAELLIRSTDMPLGVIAGEVGFTDANYFSRVFKRIRGVSPSAYREQDNPEIRQDSV